MRFAEKVYSKWERRRIPLQQGLLKEDAARISVLAGLDIVKSVADSRQGGIKLTVEFVFCVRPHTSLVHSDIDVRVDHPGSLSSNDTLGLLEVLLSEQQLSTSERR